MGIQMCLFGWEVFWSAFKFLGKSPDWMSNSSRSIYTKLVSIDVGVLDKCCNLEDNYNLVR